MFSIDYDANGPICQRDSVLRTRLTSDTALPENKVVTGPFVEERPSDHQDLYQLTKSQITRKCPKSLFPMSQPKYYTRNGSVSIRIHKVPLLLAVEESAVSHSLLEAEGAARCR